jgi:hypothetical protein
MLTVLRNEPIYSTPQAQIFSLFPIFIFLISAAVGRKLASKKRESTED